MKPDVSIIVNNYNSSDLVNAALESVVANAHNVSLEVIVLDDASTDGGFDRVDEKYKKDSRFTFLKNEKNIGFQATADIALRRVQGRYLMTLDTDARLWPDALRALITFMDAHREAGAATAVLHYPSGNIQNYFRRLMTPRFAFFTTVFGRLVDKYLLGLQYYKQYHYDDLDISRVFEVEQPPIASLIFRREAIEPYIMDAALDHFGDVDLCYRIYEHGYKIFLVPDAHSTHIKSASFTKKTRAWRDRTYYSGLGKYLKKHFPLAAPFLIPLLWLDRVVRALLIVTIGRAPMR